MLHQSSKPVGSFQVDSLPSGTEFKVTIKTVCVFETLKTMSEVETVVFQTLPGKAELRYDSPLETLFPDPPTNLVLENRTATSFSVKWDAPVITHFNHRYQCEFLLSFLFSGTVCPSSPRPSPTTLNTPPWEKRLLLTSQSYQMSWAPGLCTWFEWSISSSPLAVKRRSTRRPSWAALPPSHWRPKT